MTASADNQIVAPCALCGREPRDELSHVIPAFVYRWLKESSPTGFFRAASNPNRRLQDGEKRPLLCRSCEDRFSILERQFADSVFHEVHRRGNHALNFRYDDWLGRFCVATSWRSLVYAIEAHPGVSLPMGHDAAAHTALARWRAFLLRESPHIDPHWVYFFILDTPVMVPNPEDRDDFSVFIHRGTDLDTMHAEGECYIFTKMCGVLIVGTVCDPNPRQWRGPKVGLSGGHYRCPHDDRVSPLFFEYFNTAIDQIRSARTEISQRQIKVMESSLAKRFHAR